MKITSNFEISNIFGFFAILLAAINIFGGFLVTQRMLQMYKKREKIKIKNMSLNLAAFLYLVSGVLFILALRGLSSPETSRQGNFFGILGMIIAIIVTFLVVGSFSKIFIFVLIFLSIGGIIGSIIAYQNSYDRHATISCRIS